MFEYFEEFGYNMAKDYYENWLEEEGEIIDKDELMCSCGECVCHNFGYDCRDNKEIFEWVGYTIDDGFMTMLREWLIDADSVDELAGEEYEEIGEEDGEAYEKKVDAACKAYLADHDGDFWTSDVDKGVDRFIYEYYGNPTQS